MPHTRITRSGGSGYEQKRSASTPMGTNVTGRPVISATIGTAPRKPTKM